MYFHVPKKNILGGLELLVRFTLLILIRYDIFNTLKWRCMATRHWGRKALFYCREKFLAKNPAALLIVSILQLRSRPIFPGRKASGFFITLNGNDYPSLFKIILSNIFCPYSNAVAVWNASTKSFDSDRNILPVARMGDAALPWVRYKKPSLSIFRRSERILSYTFPKRNFRIIRHNFEG